jgi:SAM-dependent methyltransferase
MKENTMLDRSQADFSFLLDNACASQMIPRSSFGHLDQSICLWNYIRIADDIARQTRGDLLDWGCGYGQMTYLLQQRGLRVTSFDVGPRDAQLPDIPICRNLNVVRSTDPTKLPFASACFNAVLSCGVLEHVDEGSQAGNELKSLREIARILRPNGLLLIYQLPQKNAWQESLIRRFKLGYAHPRRYKANEIIQMLRDTGYEVQRMRRANLIPKNLTGMPNILRRFYSLFSRLLIAIDGRLAQVPGFRQVAGALEITARKII